MFVVGRFLRKEIRKPQNVGAWQEVIDGVKQKTRSVVYFFEFPGRSSTSEDNPVVWRVQSDN